MLKYVLDCSVVIKWFLPENFSNKAESLLILAHKNQILLYAPDLLFAEFGNVLWKKFMKKEITLENGKEIILSMRHIPIVFESSRSFMNECYELSSQTQCTFYDCLYLIHAIAHNCQLITADRKFFQKISSGKFSQHILWIENI